MVNYRDYLEGIPRLSEQSLDQRLELSRRIGFAVGQIQEAMGLLEDTDKSDSRYWAYKALIRAKAMLENGDIAL